MGILLQSGASPSAGRLSRLGDWGGAAWGFEHISVNTPGYSKIVLRGKECNSYWNK